MDIRNISLNRIYLGKNSRLDVSQEEITGLMESIKNQGLLQPIGISKNGKGYQVVYGNRRVMAYSKLGKKSIPAIVIPPGASQEEIDLQNLAENVQRRNIGLTEVGRYVEHLKSQGLTYKQMSLRLGVSANYLQTCARSFQQVPKKFRSKVTAKYGSEKVAPGKITLAHTKSIDTARRKYSLNPSQKEKLFEIALSPQFVPEKVDEYAALVKRGKSVNSCLKGVERVKKVNVNFTISEDEWERIYSKYVANGAHKSMGEVFRLKLQDKLSFRFKMEGV